MYLEASPTAPPEKQRRKSTPRGVKVLRAMVAQIDALTKTELKLGQRAKLLIERSGLVRSLIVAETDTRVERLTGEIENLKRELERVAGRAKETRPPSPAEAALAQYSAEIAGRA